MHGNEPLGSLSGNLMKRQVTKVLQEFLVLAETLGECYASVWHSLLVEALKYFPVTSI
jgi:hypothetical protein